MRETNHNLVTFVYQDKSCYRDRVNRAAGRRSVVMPVRQASAGRACPNVPCPNEFVQAGVRSGEVFAAQLRQFYHDGTNPAHLSGLIHLVSFIMTRKLPSIYLDFAKTHANPDTDGNFPYHRAVRRQSVPHPRNKNSVA
jgi:hypothetical protein